MALEDPTFKHDLRKEGYSKEEKYFYDLNRELIEERRKQLDARRAERQLKEQRGEHWMKCPKCGSKMETEDFCGIKVEQCSSCKGIYLDQDELETMLSARQHRSFVSRLLKRLFSVPREASQDLF